MDIIIHSSGYDIVYKGKVIYFGFMPDATESEKKIAADKKLSEIESIGVESFYTPDPKPTLSETDEAILNTNANVEYLVALKELEV